MMERIVTHDVDRVPTDGIQGTPREWGLRAKRVIKHNHTRSFRKTLSASLFVGVWYSPSALKDKPWCIAYFFKEPSEKGLRWSYETHYYATWKELKSAHPFQFKDFNADLRYPVMGVKA